jgi:hypothetical protein
MNQEEIELAEVGDFLIFKPLEEILSCRQITWWNNPKMNYLPEEGIRIRINECLLKRIKNGWRDELCHIQKRGNTHNLWVISIHTVELEKINNHAILGEILEPLSI